jgi:predicted Zn-dependent protease
MKWMLLTLLMTASFGAAAISAEKEIFTAMETEIGRAMESLRIEGMEPPYFVSLRVLDIENQNLTAVFGALQTRSAVDRRRLVQALVRVGSPDLDNTNFRDEYTYSFSQGQGSINIPLQDEITALRCAFWQAFDAAYKDSVEQLSRKKGYLDAHPQEEYPKDFLPAPEKTVLSVPLPKPLQLDGLIPYVEKMSGHLRSASFLTLGKAMLAGNQVIRSYLDSEGNRYVWPESIVVLQVDLKTYTQEWYPIGERLEWTVKNVENLPELSEVEKKLDEVLAYLKALREQKPLESYQGPVVFTGEAAGQFFVDILARGASRARKPIPSAGYWSGGSEGFFGERVGWKILPPTFAVWDRPTLQQWERAPLVGYLPVDDEGVKPKDIELVREGKLVSLPMRRTATKKLGEVNGHARGGLFQEPDSVITNLFVEDRGGLDSKDFQEKILSTASDMGLCDVLVITRLRNRSEMSESTGLFEEDETSALFRQSRRNLLRPPSEMFLLNVKTGEKKPAWGLDFSSVTERVLRDILASTTQRTLHQTLSFGLGGVPLSVVAPDILVEEMVLEKSRVEKQRIPEVPMPGLE